jgi:hypothetical protein
MPEPQSFTLDLENKGLLISRPGDVLPDGYLPNLLNMTADKSGFLMSRGGTARVNGTNIGPVHSLGRITVQGTPHTYQGAGTKLFRNWVEIEHGFSGNPLTMRDGGPDLSVTPFEIVWDSLRRVKDDGVNVTGFGIAGPMAMASAVETAITSKTIDLFEYPDNTSIQAAWPTFAATVTSSSTDPFQGTYAGSLAVAKSTTGYMTMIAPFDLGKFTVAGDSDDNDFISIALRVDVAANITEVRLMFDVDPLVNDFAHNYYWKSIVADVSNAAAQGIQTAPQAFSSTVSLAALQLQFPGQLNGKLSQSQLLAINNSLDPSQIAAANKALAATLQPANLPTGTSQWLQIFIRKSEFVRVGTATTNWSNVAGIRIQIQTNDSGAVNLGMDDLIMQSGNGLNANNYEWIYRYRNNLTGMTSPFSPVMTSQVEVDATNATVTVRNPRDLQATHIELYRKGGLTSVFSFAAEKVVAAWTGTTTITDSTADQNQGNVPDLTQIELANLEQLASQTCTSAQKTANSGGTYTDVTAAVSDDNTTTYADLSSLPNLGGGGWLVIGADQLFRQILVIMAGANTNQSVLTVQYWNGSSWYAVQDQIDGTDNIGATLGLSGTVEFDIPSDWAISSVNGIDAYYVRLSVSATLSAVVRVAEARVGANAFDPVTMEVFNGRLWSNDSRHKDRIWYSERFTPEIFLANNYVARSRSGDPIVRPFGLDDQLFVFSQATVDRLIGSAPDSFQLIPTGSEVGLFGNAICRGRGRIYYRAAGGIYALPGSGFSEKMTLPIQPLFDGVGFGSPDGSMAPIAVFYKGTEAMEYHGSKIWYAYTDENTVRQEITFDFDLSRWEPTDRPATSYVRLDDIGQLYSGSSDGLVYQRNNGNTDQGVPINIRFTTPYLDFGGQSVTKQITEIVIDCDLQGQTIPFFAGFDNGQAPAQSVGLTNSARGPVYFPLSDDTQCRNVSLGVQGTNGSQAVKFYKITFFYIPLRSPVTKLPTDWDNLGYAGDKRLRQLQIEIDTQDVTSVEVQVDNQTTQTLQITTIGRQIVPFSLLADTIGKLTRLIFSSASPFRYYSHQFEFLADPLQMTRYDTIDLDFGYTRWKYIRRLWIAAQTPSTIIVQISVDESLRYTSPPILIQSASGWIKYELILPPGLKGKTFRFVITSTSGFKVFLNQSDVEWYPMAGERGYQRAPLADQEYLPATRQR